MTAPAWRPVTALIARAAPFLEQVPVGALPAGPQLAEPIRRRRRAGHLCLACGAPAVAAVISWPCDSEHNPGRPGAFPDLVRGQPR